MPRATASKLKSEKSDTLTAPLSVAFRADERETVRHAAFLSGESMSAFIRAATVKAAQRVVKAAAMDNAA